MLGLPDGTIGTAWPVLRKGFGAPLANLGIVLLVGTAGNVASSSFAGVVFARLGARATIMLAGVAGAAGAFGVVVAPSFGVFVLAGAFLGVAAGLLDSAVNTSVAMTGRNRLLNMVHGAYGIGTAVAPLVVTAALLAGSWRSSYGFILAAELVLVAAWWMAGRRARPAPTAGSVAASSPTSGEGILATAAELEGAGSGARTELPAGTELPPGGKLPAGTELPPGGKLPAGGKLPPGGKAFHQGDRRRVITVVGLGLVVFMIYTGFEVSAGQWSPSFDRDVLHMGAGVTGVVTFGYWGALTAARFALAVPRRPVAPELVVRWGCVVALAGAALLWWRPAAVLAPIGLVIVGAALAGVFPALVALTPRRVGEQFAHHVIGWQIGAASLGGSAISALFGLVFQHSGLGELGPALVAVGGLLVVGSVALERVAAV